MRFAPALGASLAAGVAATAWTALTLAEFGYFVAFLPLLAFPATTIAVFLLLTRDRTAGESRGLAPQDLFAAGIACATLLLSCPPDEILLGGQDPGVYVHTAAAVARQGSLLLKEPDLAALTAEERELISRSLYGITEPFPGMWLLPDGRISPQFYHLYPSLMAVVWPLGGIRAALLVNPLLNVGAVLALYALAALLLGRGWGLAAALVHALSPAQIWQAKFPTAEMTTQFFLLAGVALLAQATADDAPPPILAPLSGAVLGMAALTRYDTIIFLVPLIAVLLWGMGPAGKTRPVLIVVGTTILFCAQAWLHQQFISPYYRPLDTIVGWSLAVAAVLIPAVLLLRRTGTWQHLAEGIGRSETMIRAAVATLLAGWILFGWFIRPRLAGQGRVGHLFRLLVGDPSTSRLAKLLAGTESRNMLYVVDLLGAVGLLALLAGIALLVVQRRRLWETAWTAASLGVLVVLTVNVFHDHFLMWVSRRFVPVVIPFASVGIAAAGALAANVSGRRRPALTMAGSAVVVAVLLLNGGSTRALAREREWPGLIAWYETFEKAIPASAALYSDQPGFAAPVRFISGRRAYEMHSRNPERIGRLVALMRRKAAAGGEVFYLSQQPFEDPQATGLLPVGAYPLRSSILAAPRSGVPRETRYRGADFVLYRVQP